MPTRKAVALLRVSTAQQSKGDKTGIDRQQDDINFYCDEHDLEIAETFAFDGISGAIVTRTPRFKEMLALLKKPQIAGIVLSALDRFSRPEKLGDYKVFEFIPDGKKLFCDVGEVDINTQDGRDKVVLALEMANKERQRIKWRTYRSKELLRKDASISIDRLPKGVKHVKDGPRTKRGTFEYTSYAFEKVKPAFERIAKGATIYDTANELGFASHVALRETLKNPWWIGVKHRTKTRTKTYSEEKGRYSYGGRIDHSNPVEMPTNLAEAPLVSVQLFQKVQGILATHRNSWTQRKTLVNEFLGAGLCYCGECGAKLYHKKESRQGKPPYYICASKWTLKQPCSSRRFRAKDLDDEIGLQAILHLTDEKFVEARLRELMSVGATSERKAEVKRLTAHVAELEKRKRNLVKAIAAVGDVDLISELKAANQDLTIARSNLAIATEQYQSVISERDAKAVARDIHREFSGFMQKDRSEQKAILVQYIERIEVVRDAKDDVRVTFKVKVGVPMTDWAWPEPVKPKPPKGGKSQPIRVVQDGRIGNGTSVPSAFRRTKLQGQSSRISWTLALSIWSCPSRRC